MGNVRSKISNSKVPHFDLIIDYIVCYWFRLTVPNKSFPNAIIKLIQSIYGTHDTIDGSYKTNNVSMEIKYDINKDVYTFTLNFYLYYDPCEGMEMISDGQYSVSGNFKGTFIQINPMNFKLQFDNESLLKIPKTLNWMLNHSNRREQYLNRIQNFKHNDVQNLYNHVVTTTDWQNSYNFKSTFRYTVDKNGIENVFIDFHDKYIEICDQLKKKPLPVYIGSEFTVQKTSRYYSQLYFNNHSWNLYKYSLFDVFTYRKSPKYNPYRHPSHSPPTLTVSIKIDFEVNYFELNYTHYETLEMRGKINIDGSLEFDDISYGVLKQLLKNKFKISKFKLIKLEKITKKKINCVCDETILWEMICEAQRGDGTWNFLILKEYNENVLYIGNLHKIVETKGNKANINHEWILFISLSNQKMVKTNSIKKVIYKLHPTFKPNVIECDKEPFYLKRCGWGVFRIDVSIVFKEKYNREDLICSHMLDFAKPVQMTKIKSDGSDEVSYADNYDDFYNK
eukprot:337821_1